MLHYGLHDNKKDGKRLFIQTYRILIEPEVTDPPRYLVPELISPA